MPADREVSAREHAVEGREHRVLRDHGDVLLALVALAQDARRASSLRGGDRLAAASPRPGCGTASRVLNSACAAATGTITSSSMSMPSERPLRREHADHAEAPVADAQPLAERRARGRRARRATLRADHAHRRGRARVAAAAGTGPAPSPAADRDEARPSSRGPGTSRCAAAARRASPAPTTSGATRRTAGLRAQRERVVEREVARRLADEHAGHRAGGLACGPGATISRLVPSEPNWLSDVAPRALAERGERDDRGDADRHREQHQRAARADSRAAARAARTRAGRASRIGSAPLVAARPPVDHAHAPARARADLRVVRHDDQREPPSSCSSSRIRDHLAARAAVEVAGRLVGEQQRRRHRRSRARSRRAGAGRRRAASGRWCARVGEPDARRAVGRDARAALGRARSRRGPSAARRSRAAVRRGTRWKNWKTKPIRSRRTRACSSSSSVGDVAAVERGSARRRAVEQPERR